MRSSGTQSSQLEIVSKANQQKVAVRLGIKAGYSGAAGLLFAVELKWSTPKLRRDQGASTSPMVRDCQTTTLRTTRKSEIAEYVRVLPSLVVDLVLEASLLVVTFVWLHFNDLGLIEQFMMEAENFLVLDISRLWGRCGGHTCGSRLKLSCWFLDRRGNQVGKKG